MTIFNYALASVKYHRKYLMKYFILAAMMMALIVIIFCLKNVLTTVEHQITETLKDYNASDIETGFHQRMDVLQTVYSRFLTGCLVLLAALTGIFGFNYLLRRKEEFLVLKESGISKTRMCCQIFLEFLIPTLLIVLGLYLVFLIFQPLIQRLLQVLQLTAVRHFSFQQLAGNNHEQTTLMVRLPMNNAALLNSAFIGNREWLTIIAKSCVLCGVVVFLIDLICLPFSFFFARRKFQ